MTTEVRTIRDDELADWVDTMHTGFLEETSPGEVDFRRPAMDLDRTWAAFEDGRIVGALNTFPTDLTVPGGATVVVAALTNVSVIATHRRRGHLRAMVAADLQACKDRGEVASILIAAEYPIYGRFGYGQATEHATWTIDARRAAFARPTTGTIELVDPITLRSEAPRIYEVHRRANPGEIGRSERRWDISLGITPAPGRPQVSTFRVLARDEDGLPTGYARYHVDSTWSQRRPTATLTVDELITTDAASAARLWEYLTQVDWVATLRAEDRSVEEPLRWLLRDARAAEMHGRADFLWLRLLDTATALAARRYLAPGRVVLDVIDPAGLAGGRMALDGGPDGASCVPTDAPADLGLSIGALGTAYLGGTSLGVLAAAGLVEEYRRGSLLVADAMFRSPTLPWCSTWF